MLNPAVTWLSAFTLAFMASSSGSLGWLMLFCVIPIVVAALSRRKTGYPKLFFVMAAIVVLVRIGFRVLFGSSGATGPGWQLPELNLSLGPLGDLHLLGFVTVSAVLAGLTDGLRLAAIILAIGMASTLVSARRLLRYTPAALYELSTAVSISVNLAPQLIKSLARVQRARQLRGRSRRISVLSSIVIPVLEDTIDQSLALAASMDSRGFGYLRPSSRGKLRNLLALAFVLIAIGVYLLLTGSAVVAFASLGLSLILTAFAVRTASKSTVRTSGTTLVWSVADRLFVLAIAAVILLRITGWWKS
jgi:energy-coupling factor transport system permease protein